MRKRIYIPKAVVDDISIRLAEGVSNTLADYDSSSEDEDAFTGHLGALLTTRSRKVVVKDDEVSGLWSWSLRYRKFRGRGPRATEKLLGADGIFEFSLDGYGYTDKKSLLFQSKMGASASRPLVEQCARLSTWREAAIVVSYAEDGINAYSIDDALKAKGDLAKATPKSLDQYLSGPFLGCLIGDMDLRYSPDTRMLTWRDLQGEVVSVSFAVKHGIHLKVTPPKRGASDWIGRVLTQDEVHKHRMQVSDDEVLALTPGDPADKFKSNHRMLAKIYHPDAWSGFPLDIQELMTRRMQEVNAAYDNLKE